MDHNPQESQMSDESMVRTLDAQARCIWPQEAALFDRYGVPSQVLDVGCGTGEITWRLAERYGDAHLLGVDLIEAHLVTARQRTAAHGSRVQFEARDAFDLGLPEATYDLVVNRHLLQAVPEPARVVQECLRVLKPGGWIHLLLEDYTMIQFEGASDALDRFWLNGPVMFGRSLGCDMRVGRRGPSLLAGCEDVRVDYVVVDTVRCAPRDVADIWRAWRDGYVEALSEVTGRDPASVTADWDEMIRLILDGYMVWQVPVVSARKPKNPR